MAGTFSDEVCAACARKILDNYNLLKGRSELKNSTKQDNFIIYYLISQLSVVTINQSRHGGGVVF
jgi:hypothetical protein